MNRKLYFLKNYLCHSALSLILTFVVFTAHAQNTREELPLNKDFQFTSGLYKNVEQLRTNQPEILFQNLGGGLVFMQNDLLLKIEDLYPRGLPEQPYDLNDFQIITYKGIPFFRINEDNERGFSVYAGLRVRGRLSYFSYDRPYTDSVLIKAYNPLTGRAFREQKMSTPQIEKIRNIVNIETGLCYDFNVENLQKLIADDASLLKTLNATPASEANEKLERFLLIYDDRNPIYLPATIEKEPIDD